MKNLTVPKRARNRAGTIVLIGCVLTGLIGCAPGGPLSFTIDESGTAPEAGPTEIPATLVRVIDGDTIVAQPMDPQGGAPEGEPLRVRVLGIDTPEMDECGGEEAKAEVGRLIEDGAPITLRYDDKADRVDRYDRALAYVEISSVDLGEMLVSEGFAGAWYPRSAPEPSRFSTYDEAEQQAEAQGLGLWSSCDTLGR